jgi:hypothetical protein
MPDQRRSSLREVRAELSEGFPDLNGNLVGVRKRRQGTKLAVAIPEDWARWANPLLFFVSGSAFVAPTFWFILDRTYRNFGLLEVLFGILGIVFLVLCGRLVLLGSRIGETIVEISKEPARSGEALDYFILQGRAAAGVQSMEARLQLRRYTRGSIFRLEVDVPLAGGAPEPDGRRKIAGSLVIPSAPNEVLASTHKKEWLLLVKFRFKGGNEFDEDHTIQVEPQ